MSEFPQCLLFSGHGMLYLQTHMCLAYVFTFLLLVYSWARVYIPSEMTYPLEIAIHLLD